VSSYILTRLSKLSLANTSLITRFLVPEQRTIRSVNEKKNFITIHQEPIFTAVGAGPNSFSQFHCFYPAHLLRYTNGHLLILLLSSISASLWSCLTAILRVSPTLLRPYSTPT
jgi:hypothetical protein